jgi:hypothetical protein
MKVLCLHVTLLQINFRLKLHTAPKETSLFRSFPEDNMI